MQEIPFSSITTERRRREGWKDDRTYVTAREFSDFIIDGQSLFEMIGGDSMSCFVRGYRKDNKAAVESLLTSSGNKRVAIYVCPECGDIGCGAIFTQVHVLGGYVVWDGLVWDNEIYDEIYDGSREAFAEKKVGTAPVRSGGV